MDNMLMSVQELGESLSMAFQIPGGLCFRDGPVTSGFWGFMHVSYSQCMLLQHGTW